MKYGFIGLGNMGAAIIRGMCASGQFAPGDIYGFDSSGAVARSLAEECAIHPCATLEELLGHADCIILSVKPQVLPAVLPAVKKARRGGELYISIAAGKSIAYFEEALGEDAALVRVMPNINAKIGASTSCLSPSSHTSAAQKDAVVHLFETVGTVIELPESLLPVFSAIGGASPAFTYLYIDAMARAAVKAGMPKNQALAVAASAVYGSAKMIMESGEHPWALVDQVCSPGGTTIEGVCALQNNGFESAVHQAVNAVLEKDKQLG